MNIVIFGLTISSSWGNGHATLWRGLCRSLVALRHRVTFFEHDQPYYAGARDMVAMEGCDLVLYDSWESVCAQALRSVTDADVAIVTSYCADGIAATQLLASSGRALNVFYDLDTPVTLACLNNGGSLSYIGPDGLAGFDLVLSYTGGAALDQLRERLGARRVAALYGHVDPEVHRPADKVPHYAADLSYLGTYSPDRQETLAALLVETARRRNHGRFVIGGALYPDEFPWTPNIHFVRHLPPSEHAAFFSSSRLTLNVTRGPMVEMGWCPSGRLFEAAACGAAVLSDYWQGLDTFFEPGEEILVASNTEDALAALDLDDAEIQRIATAGRDRVLTEHSSAKRAGQLIELLESAHSPLSVGA
jgi:spore maturation protein CgeB